MIEPDSITVKGLQSGKFLGTLPELYELEEVTENNKWHNHDSVFSHTISVLKNLERLLKKNPLPVSRRLQKIIGKHSSRQLLFLAAVLHDIAKKETIIRHFLKTDCPHHEEKGAVKSKKILRRFGLSAKEKEFVTSLVRFHGEAHTMVNMGKKSFEKFRNRHKSAFIELVLLIMADQSGSQLKQNNPAEFKRRILFYRQILRSYKS